MRLFSYPRNQQWSLDDSAQRAVTKIILDKSG